MLFPFPPHSRRLLRIFFFLIVPPTTTGQWRVQQVPERDDAEKPTPREYGKEDDHIVEWSVRAKLKNERDEI